MKKFGLLGHNISYSLSPRMYNFLFKSIGKENEYSYFLLDVPEEQVQGSLDLLRDGEIDGLNVTIPYKQKVIKYLDSLSEEAKKIGSINVIYMKDGKITGSNTDGLGAIDSLKQAGTKLENNRALILGNGGASRSLTYELCQNNLEKVYICGRDLAKTQRLISELGRISKTSLEPLEYNSISKVLSYVGLIINSTPLGTKGDLEDKCFLTSDSCLELSPSTVVMDIIYNPMETILLNIAKRAGCKTIDGTYMLANQGARALKLFLNFNVDPELLRQAVLSGVKK